MTSKATNRFSPEVRTRAVRAWFWITKPSDVPKGFGRNESMHAQVPSIPDTFHQQSSTSLKNQSKERHLGEPWEAAAR